MMRRTGSIWRAIQAFFETPMSYYLRTLLIPRRIARLRFTLYELFGLMTIAAISLAIGLSFLHDSLAVSLGIIGASLFNGIACYIVGIGIGRCSARHLPDDDRPISRFTIRDMLWLTAVVAVLVAWRVGYNNWERERAIQRQSQVELGSISGKLEAFGRSRAVRASNLAHLPSTPDSPMTDERVKEIDERLTEVNLTYNPESDQFQTADMFASRGRSQVEWEDVVVYLPDLSVNEMMRYKARKQHASRRATQELP